ncbi:MAG TPA: outer membrane beta-barrel protein [Xanthobacteraceae bacterium]|nr:outer membrane beta-barrel protein [Xanthobacteraceae bacterium]
MRKFLLVTAALVALADPAMAADLRARPVYKAPPAPPPVQFSWTGCSVGGHVGGLWARKDWSDRSISFVPGEPIPSFGQSFGGHDADGWLGGVQAGCDYQLGGGIVIGIQGDYSWTDAKGSNVNLVAPFITDQTRIKSLATVTGRLGYAWERFLGYVKGGGAWERDEYAITTATSVDTAAETRRGWTIGVGGEYAFTNSLSGFAEYNYYDFRSRDLTFTTTPLGSFIANIKETKSVARAGLNVRFGGWAAPAAAK